MHRLANALCKRGHHITCVSYSPRPESAAYDHVKLAYRSTAKVLRKIDPARKFCSIRAAGYDILHYHGDDYLVRDEKRRLRTFYGSALNEALHARKPGRFFYQGLFYLFEWLSCLNQGIKVGISKATCTALPMVSTVIPCGVPLNLYTPSNGKTEYPSILFVGDLGSRKRGDLLVTLFNNDIIKKYPDCRLTVVGPEPCSGENIRYLGHISEEELIAEYRKAWLYCMPSSYEGFGVPAIEAMACGSVVVACDNRGIREIIENNRNGMITDDANLSYTIRRLLSDDTLRDRLVGGGIETVKKDYDIDSVAARYEELYRFLSYLE